MSCAFVAACASSSPGPAGVAPGDSGGGSSGGGGGEGGGADTGGANGIDAAMADVAAGGDDSGGGAMEGGDDSAAVDAAALDASVDAPVGNGMFALTSTAFMNNGVIALKYRCMQANVSPPLSWTPGPAGTQSYAVTLVHGTSAYHWVLWDIPATTTSLPEGVARVAAPPDPAGSKQTQPNLDGSTWYGYTGPCPMSAQLQSYVYSVYALKVATLPGVTSQSTGAAVDSVIQTNKLATATLTAMAAK